MFHARSPSPCQSQHSRLVLTSRPLPAPLQGQRRPLSQSVLALELPHQGWERPTASDENTEALDPQFLETLLVKKELGGEWPGRTQGHTQWPPC